MTSIERTAYPRFRRVVSARELHGFYAPLPNEVDWARSVTRSDEHLLALIVSLKCFQRLAHFPRVGDVPSVVVDHVRGCLYLPEAVASIYGTDRTQRVHHELIRRRIGVVNDPERARAVGAAAIRDAGQAKNNPPDLINVALEELVRLALELPGFSTLDEMASRIRLAVNSEIFDGIAGRMTPLERAALDGLLELAGYGLKSDFDRLKKPARRASWSHFKEQVAHLAWGDSLGNTDAWLAGIAPSKITDFAGEAGVADAACGEQWNEKCR